MALGERHGQGLDKVAGLWSTSLIQYDIQLMRDYS